MNNQSVSRTKKVSIDFLFLDLSTCERCMDTENNLDAVIQELRLPFQTLGLELLVNKVNVITEELAAKYKFESSPTIRVNGLDILGELKENVCESCCEISGNVTMCRSFEHEGVSYNDPPKAMIMDGILQVLYSNQGTKTSSKYAIPENIRSFYKGVEKKSCSCGSGSCC